MSTQTQMDIMIVTLDDTTAMNLTAAQFHVAARGERFKIEVTHDDTDGWHDATVRLPQPGVFVTVGDVVLFSRGTHWKEID